MRIFSMFQKSNQVYFPGNTTYFKFKENFELYKRIFFKLGINFKVIEKQICSGIQVLEAGYEAEARKLARRNFEIFKEEEVKSIITNSPESYKVFLQDYPELLPDWNLDVENIWEMMLDRLERKPKVIKHKAMEAVSYHDNCYLGRYCKIYDAPRKILELIGYEIIEMADSKSESVCCGSCGGVNISNPKLADEIAKQRILQAKRLGVKKLIVCSMDNYELLKRNSQDSGIEILELSEVLGLALGLNIEEKDEEEILDKEDEILKDTKANIMIDEEIKEDDY